VLDIKVNSKIQSNMVWVHKDLKMAMFMLDHMKKEDRMDMDNIITKIKIYIKENLKTD
jgi:hypothetical protein